MSHAESLYATQSIGHHLLLDKSCFQACVFADVIHHCRSGMSFSRSFRGPPQLNATLSNFLRLIGSTFEILMKPVVKVLESASCCMRADRVLQGPFNALNVKLIELQQHASSN